MSRADLSRVLYEWSSARRAVTVPAVAAMAGALASTAWAWAPMSLVADVVRQPSRLPRLRMLSLATAWSALETAGVAIAAMQWATGRSDAPESSYALQRWWVNRLLDALRLLGNVQLEVQGDPIAPGPVVMLARHATIADSLIPAWLLARHDLRPRYVLKRDLLLDPCLDVVGNRVPNHFVVRDGDDTDRELDAIRALSGGMSAQDGAVIFPEGTVATDPRRARALERVAERDPSRAQRLCALRTLIPPRHAGARALLEGCPTADVLLVAHRGLEGFERLADTPAHLPLEAAVQVRVERVARRDVPVGAEFVQWLDDRWLRLDDWIGRCE